MSWVTRPQPTPCAASITHAPRRQIFAQPWPGEGAGNSSVSNKTQDTKADDTQILQSPDSAVKIVASRCATVTAFHQEAVYVGRIVTSDSYRSLRRQPFHKPRTNTAKVDRVGR